MSSSIVIFYSRTGNTRVVAHCLAEITGAELEELTPATYHGGSWGWLKAIAEAAFGRMPRLLQPLEDVGDYDVVYIGGPIWVGRCAPAVRSYARRYLPGTHRLAFFATQGGTSIRRAWADLARLCGTEPVATLTVRADHVRDPELRGEIARFAIRAQRAPVPGGVGAAHRESAPMA